MDLEDILLNEVSQTEKDKKHDFTHMWIIKNKWISEAKQKQTHRSKQKKDGYQRG